MGCSKFSWTIADTHAAVRDGPSLKFRIVNRDFEPDESDDEVRMILENVESNF
jgi:hypothetical protein